MLHNLRLLEKQKASGEQIRDFVRNENQELIKGMERQNIFYDKYRLRLLSVHHAGTQGELLVEDTYGGSQFVPQVNRVLAVMLRHVFDSTLIADMKLFEKESAVMNLTGVFDERPGESEKRVRLLLQEAASSVHAYVKKEKVGGVEYLIAGKPAADAALIARTEAQETDKDRFLKDPLVRAVLPRVEVAVQ